MRHAILITAIAVATAGCNQSPRATEHANAAVETSPANTAAPANTSAPVTYADPAMARQVREALAKQLQEETRAMQARLPVRMDAVSEITAIRAEGLETIYTARVTVAVPNIETARAAAQAQAQANICGNAPAREMVRHGGSYRYEFTDPAGATFTTRVTSCS
jgi:hypothetical protein